MSVFEGNTECLEPSCCLPIHLAVLTQSQVYTVDPCEFEHFGTTESFILVKISIIKMWLLWQIRIPQVR